MWIYLKNNWVLFILKMSGSRGSPCTKLKEQSPSCDTNRFSASQEIPRNTWNPKFHYRIHKSLQPVPILSPINPVHATIPLLQVSF